MKSRHWRVLVSVVAISLATLGCQQERRFDKLKLPWPAWGKPASQTPTETSPSPSLANSFVNTFRVWTLKSAGDEACLERGWSYLDELLPGRIQHWEVLRRNGLRCGIGQVSDWPAVKAQLEQCQTRTSRDNPPMDVSVGRMTSVTLLTDTMERDRTLFYYDGEGRLRGKDGTGRLQLVLTSVGKTGDGRTRIVFSPRIVESVSRLERLTPARAHRAGSKTVEQELENLSIVIDLGPDEFTLIGATSGNLPKSLIGSQLFVRWQKGQKHLYYVLVRPVGAQEKPERIGGSEDEPTAE